MMNIINVEDTLKRNKKYLKENFHVSNIGLFNGDLKDLNSPENDIDILVKFEKAYKNFYNLTQLRYYLENLLKRDVDLINIDVLRPCIKNSILREVINI